jgi:hypothetical protein
MLNKSPVQKPAASGQGLGGTAPLEEARMYQLYTSVLAVLLGS